LLAPGLCGDVQYLRLQILTQRDEIEVSKLIGATYCVHPPAFYYLGLLQGLGRRGVAVGIVACRAGAAQSEVRRAGESTVSVFASLFCRRRALAWSLFAGLLGWLGAHLSVSRHLRDIEPS